MTQTGVLPTQPAVKIGGIPAAVQYAGVVTPGLYQINVTVPPSAPAGDASLAIAYDGFSTNTATISIAAGTPTLTSINPSAGTSGSLVTVAIAGASTSFVPGQTVANFGAGIGVGGGQVGLAGAVTVTSATSATAQIAIDPSAAVGSRTVTLTTGSQSVSLNNAFTVGSPPAAMGPLSVAQTVPANGATAVSMTPTIQIVFNEPLDLATVGPAMFALANPSGTLQAAVSCDGTGTVVTLTPAGLLRPQTVYTVTVSARVRNQAENPLGATYAFSFTTVPPASVSGAVTVPSGLDATTLSVVGFGGSVASPVAGGSFSAMLNPAGTGLVAAMLPGGSFGLLTMTVAGASSTSGSTGSGDGSQPAVHVRATHWQVTASSAAVPPNGIVVDFQTTAEALVFLSPYLLTANPQNASSIMTAIAANPATAQLAQALTQSWSETDPLNDPTVQSARQAAVQAVVQGLVADAVTQQKSTERDLRANDASSGLPSPPTLALTPNCWPSTASGSGGLPCIDLDYLSFPSGSVSVDQASGNYVVSPNNCTNATLLGCAVGWWVAPRRSRHRRTRAIR